MTGALCRGSPLYPSGWTDKRRPASLPTSVWAASRAGCRAPAPAQRAAFRADCRYTPARHPAPDAAGVNGHTVWFLKHHTAQAGLPPCAHRPPNGFPALRSRRGYRQFPLPSWRAGVKAPQYRHAAGQCPVRRLKPPYKARGCFAAATAGFARFLLCSITGALHWRWQTAGRAGHRHRAPPPHGQ